jgi:hypothetical protein
MTTLIAVIDINDHTLRYKQETFTQFMLLAFLQSVTGLYDAERLKGVKAPATLLEFE